MPTTTKPDPASVERDATDRLAQIRAAGGWMRKPLGPSPAWLRLLVERDAVAIVGKSDHVLIVINEPL